MQRKAILCATRVPFISFRATNCTPTSMKAIFKLSLGFLLLCSGVNTLFAANVLVTWKTQTANYAAVGVSVAVEVYSSSAEYPLTSMTTPSAAVSANSGIYTKTVTLSIADSYLNGRVFIKVTPLSGGNANIARYSEYVTVVPGGVSAPEFGTEALTRTTPPEDKSILAAADLSVIGSIDAKDIIQFGTRADSAENPGAVLSYNDISTIAQFELTKPNSLDQSLWQWKAYKPDESIALPMTLRADGSLTLTGPDGSAMSLTPSGHFLKNGNAVEFIAQNGSGVLHELTIGEYGWNDGSETSLNVYGNIFTTGGIMRLHSDAIDPTLYLTSGSPSVFGLIHISDNIEWNSLSNTQDMTFNLSLPAGEEYGIANRPYWAWTVGGQPGRVIAALDPVNGGMFFYAAPGQERVVVPNYKHGVGDQINWDYLPPVPEANTIAIKPNAGEITVGPKKVVLTSESSGMVVSHKVALGPDATVESPGGIAAGVGVAAAANQVVVGRYNDIEPRLDGTNPRVGGFVVGAGTENARKNALRVNDDGVVLIYPAGDIGMGGFQAGEKP